MSVHQPIGRAIFAKAILASGLALLTWGAAIIGVSTALIAPARATPIYSTTLDQSGASSGQGSGPWATVSMSDEANGTAVDVTVSLLAAATGFVSTGSHQAFSFSIPGAITIENLTTGFSIGPTNRANAPAGTFLHSIICSVCGRGAKNPYTGSLSFSVASAQAITPLSFTPSSKGDLFAADLFANGKTGVVYTATPLSVTTTNTTPDSAPVPEPPAAAILASAMLALAFIRRRRNTASGYPPCACADL